MREVNILSKHTYPKQYDYDRKELMFHFRLRLVTEDLGGIRLGIAKTLELRKVKSKES